MLKNLGFYHLEVFVLLAKRLNLQIAAQELAIGEAAVSKIIKQLEKSLGVQLFYRTRNGLALTLAGQDLSKNVPAVIMSFEQVCRSARQVYDGEAGQLKIAFTGAVEFDLLPQYVAVFSKECPLADLRLLKMNSLDQVKALLNRKIDLGIFSLPSEIAGFSFRIVQRDKLMFVLPKGHRLAAALSALRIQDAANENFLHLERRADENCYDMLQQFFDNEAICPRVAASYASLSELVAGVARGEGIALLPTGKCLPAEGVTYRALHSNNAALHTVMAWNSDIESPLLQRFLAAIS